MKHLIMFLLMQISLDGFGQDTSLPKGYFYLHEAGMKCGCQQCYDTAKPDTTCEYMHLSIRDNGFVISRKALSIQRNGICIGHLQSDKRPFPVHYRVGWCEGKERAWRAIVELLNGKR